MNKKGERQVSLVLLVTIVAVVGFVIILYVLMQFIKSDDYSDESCRFSILTRASVPGPAEGLIPLKCTTGKICLVTDTKESCPQFIGEENTKIKISTSGGVEKSAEDISKILANSMYDCWSMTGEGKLSLFSGKDPTDFISDQFGVEITRPICLICSRVALSQELENREDILQEVNMGEYLRTTVVPGSSRTYLNTFTDKQVNSYPQAFQANLSNQSGKQTNEIAFVFSQMVVKNEAAWQSAIQKGSSTGIAVGGALLTPAGRVLGIVGVVPNLVATTIAAGISGGIAYVNQGQNLALAGTYCGAFTSQERETGQGCSLITPVDWNNKTSLNTLCAGGIEGTL